MLYELALKHLSVKPGEQALGSSYISLRTGRKLEKRTSRSVIFLRVVTSEVHVKGKRLQLKKISVGLHYLAKSIRKPSGIDLDCPEAHINMILVLLLHR